MSSHMCDDNRRITPNAWGRKLHVIRRKAFKKSYLLQTYYKYTWSFPYEGASSLPRIFHIPYLRFSSSSLPLVSVSQRFLKFEKKGPWSQAIRKKVQSDRIIVLWPWHSKFVQFFSYCVVFLILIMMNIFMR